MTAHDTQTSLNNNPTKYKTITKNVVTEHEVPEEFRDPFITDGYRQPGCSFWSCFGTLFTFHNETINVWSHLLAAICFIIFCVPEFRHHNPLQDNFAWPLLAFAMGITSMLLMSSIAHLFNCISYKARHICFFLDYAAISTYTFTAGQAFYFYSRPTRSEWLLQSAPVYLCLCALVSASSTYFCCASRHAWLNYKFVIRTMTFVLSWLCDTLPFHLRVVVCEGKEDCHSPSYRFFSRQFLAFFFAAVVNAGKIPERFMPGRFNIFGQSHHFMHVLCAVGSLDAFLAVKSDMIARRSLLADLHSVPSFYNSILAMLAVLAVNIAIVVWFAVSPVKCTDDDDEDNIACCNKCH
jgi:predicted membrane channel-forming protein YqfA (hemolysin III family)